MRTLLQVVRRMRDPGVVRVVEQLSRVNPVLDEIAWRANPRLDLVREALRQLRVALAQLERARVLAKEMR